MNPNPYAPPQTGSTASVDERARTNPFSHDEQADLFVATLAPILLKANVFTLVLASSFMVLFAARLALALQQSFVAMFLELGQAAVAVGGFVVARMILKGSTVAWVAGLVIAPVSAIASVFALATGSVGGIFCGGLSIANIVLLAVNWPVIKRIGEARNVLRSAGISTG